MISFIGNPKWAQLICGEKTSEQWMLFGSGDDNRLRRDTSELSGVMVMLYMWIVVDYEGAYLRQNSLSGTVKIYAFHRI